MKASSWGSIAKLEYALDDSLHTTIFWFTLSTVCLFLTSIHALSFGPAPCQLLLSLDNKSVRVGPPLNE